MARRGVSPREYRRQLQRLGRELQRELGHAALLGASVIVRGAKEKITVKGHIVTGALRRDINAQLASSTPTVAVVAVGVALHYGKYVEALPDGGFLFESVEENTAEAIRVIGHELEAAIRRAT